MGVDRVVALLTAQPNLRDVVLFPLMKPKMGENKENKDFKENNEQRGTLSGAGGSHLLQHVEYGHLLPAAHGLLEEHTDKTKAHLIATGAAMEALAAKFGGDLQTWKVAGMLHDLDWDKLDKDAEAHCGKTLEELLASIRAPEELLADIRAHYASKYGADYPLDTMLRKCLYCVDELTGFIIAVTYVRPSKKLADVEVSSVKKKMKDKGFAAQVDREQIKKCEELEDLYLLHFLQLL
jgi:predicted hydrolase (HD superfamily)